MVVYAKAFDGEETEEEAVQAILLVAVSVDNSYHRSWVSTSTYPITFCPRKPCFWHIAIMADRSASNALWLRIRVLH